MNGRLIGIAAVLALLLAPMTAQAQQKSAIELTTLSQLEKVVKNAKGEREVILQDVKKSKVVPGDTVVFSTRYTNTSKKSVDHVTIMNPVPQHMVYVDKSAGGKGSRIDFSVDGGRTYASPDKLTIKSKDGKVRPARADDYTHIRWVLAAPLAPGGWGTVSFKAKLK